MIVWALVIRIITSPENISDFKARFHWDLCDRRTRDRETYSENDVSYVFKFGNNDINGTASILSIATYSQVQY